MKELMVKGRFFDKLFNIFRMVIKTSPNSLGTTIEQQLKILQNSNKKWNNDITNLKNFAKAHNNLEAI